VTMAIGMFELAVVDYRSALLAGLLLTLQVSVIGMIGSIAVGLAGAATITLRIPGLRQVTKIYVEFIRNTPLLVQIFFLFYVLPTLGLTLSAYTVGCVSLVIWGGAYNVENFRAGLGAVGSGHQEAARALGFSNWRTFTCVTAPIGLRLSIPGLTNTLISVLKNSALMLGIGLAELTSVVQRLSAETFRSVELYVTLGVIYLLLVLFMSIGMHFISRRYGLEAGV